MTGGVMQYDYSTAELIVAYRSCTHFSQENVNGESSSSGKLSVGLVVRHGLRIRCLALLRDNKEVPWDFCIVSQYSYIINKIIFYLVTCRCDLLDQIVFLCTERSNRRDKRCSTQPGLSNHTYSAENPQDYWYLRHFWIGPLSKLKHNLDVGRSEVIADMTLGDLTAFYKLDEQSKRRSQQPTIRRVYDDCAKSGRAVIITGHYMLWQEKDWLGDAVCTKSDLATFWKALQHWCCKALRRIFGHLFIEVAASCAGSSFILVLWAQDPSFDCPYLLDPVKKIWGSGDGIWSSRRGFWRGVPETSLIRWCRPISAKRRRWWSLTVTETLLLRTLVQCSGTLLHLLLLEEKRKPLKTLFGNPSDGGGSGETRTARRCDMACTTSVQSAEHES